MDMVDTEPIQEAYEDVRSDATDTNWMTMAYEGNNIVLGDSGVDYEEFKEKFTDDDRLYAYIRVITGDEMSKRSKFALIGWLGSNVSPLKKAKMSTDKALVKKIIKNFAVELLCTEKDELEVENIKGHVIRAGGANYGTGE